MKKISFPFRQINTYKTQQRSTDERVNRLIEELKQNKPFDDDYVSFIIRDTDCPNWELFYALISNDYEREHNNCWTAAYLAVDLMTPFYKNNNYVEKLAFYGRSMYDFMQDLREKMGPMIKNKYDPSASHFANYSKKFIADLLHDNMSYETRHKDVANHLQQPVSLESLKETENEDSKLLKNKLYTTDAYMSTMEERADFLDLTSALGISYDATYDTFDDFDQESACNAAAAYLFLGNRDDPMKRYLLASLMDYHREND